MTAADVAPLVRSQETARPASSEGAKPLAMTVLLPFDDGRPHPTVWQAGGLPGRLLFVFHAAGRFPFSTCLARPPSG